MDESSSQTDMMRDLSEIDIVGTLLFLVLAVGVILLVQAVVPRVAERLPARYRPPLMAVVPIVRLIVLGAAVPFVVFSVVEPSVANVIAILGALGLALGFALKEFVSSLIAGVVALYELPYRPGDWVEIDGTYAEVRSIGMRTMQMVTADDTVVVVPHLVLWDRLIKNANDGTAHLQCAADFHLEAHHDGAVVERTLYDVALTSPLLKLEKPVAVVAHEEPWGTRYRLKAYPIDPRDQFRFTTDLTIRGKAALVMIGVEFARAMARSREVGD